MSEHEPTTRVFVGARRSGKTSRMVEWLLWGNSLETHVLITHNEASAKSILRGIHNLIPSFPEDRVVTYRQVENGALRDRKNLVIGLDDIEALFPGLGGGRVGAISITSSDVVELDRDWS
jgi:hypothetical protein